MALITVFFITILFLSATASFEENLARRLFFNDHKTSTITTTNIEESSFGQNFSKWLDGFLSKDSDKEKQSDSFSKLALLKKFLSSSSSSSSDKNSRLDKLFQILSKSAADDKNESSSTSNKLNRLLGFFDTHRSSTNLQLAMKLLNLAQGNSGLSSLSTTDMKSLIKFVSG